MDNQIRLQLCAEQIPGTALVAALDLEMSSSAHLDSIGYKRVGKRLANVALCRAYGRKEIKVGPTLKRVVLDRGRNDRIKVLFDDVNGQLVANPRVLGFSLRAEDGTRINSILSAKVDTDNANRIIIKALNPIEKGTLLWYGWGWDPICNVADERDMALPAFGPIEIK